jgi:ABC-type multidrug transport system fused ATPase/permease subunit
LLKHLVDALDLKAGDPRAVLVVPIGLLLAYAALRLSTSVFTELRELIFAKASFGASKQIALEVFGHLHALSLRFHLERQTGGLSPRHRARHACPAVAAVVLAVHDRAQRGGRWAWCWGRATAGASTSATCGFTAIALVVLCRPYSVLDHRVAHASFGAR